MNKHMSRRKLGLIIVAFSVVKLMIVVGLLIFSNLPVRKTTASFDEQFTLRSGDSTILTTQSGPAVKLSASQLTSTEGQECNDDPAAGACAPSSVTAVLNVGSKNYTVVGSALGAMDMAVSGNDEYQKIPYKVYLVDSDFRSYATFTVRALKKQMVKYGQQFTLKDGGIAVLQDTETANTGSLLFDTSDGAVCPAGEIYLDDILEYYSNFMSTTEQCKLKINATREGDKTRLKVIATDNKSFITFVFERL